MGGKRINLIGKRFGRWTVLEKTEERISGSIVWLCECDCGKIGKVRTAILKNGESKSCGCFQRYVVKKTGNLIKHGHARRNYKSYTYNTWEAMKTRCLNENNKDYEYYKNRYICERWMKFENFLADMGERPEGHELHRIDNSKGYSPDNCEWKEKTLHLKEHRKW